MGEKKEILQCPCGRWIESPSDYKLMFLKKLDMEIDILCPNDACYLKELGCITFKIENGKLVWKEAKFYPPYVTWNYSQLGKKKAEKIMREHLKKIVTERVEWKKVKEETLKAMESHYGKKEEKKEKKEE